VTMWRPSRVEASAPSRVPVRRSGSSSGQGSLTPLTSSVDNDYPEWLIEMNEGLDKPGDPLPLATADCML
jgi:hypothetical protein